MKEDFPQVHYYDQDFVELYNKIWHQLGNYWPSTQSESLERKRIFNYPENSFISQFEICMSSFFLVYTGKSNSVTPQLDFLYSCQEEDGAIRGDYDLETGSPILTEDNPLGLNPPLFAWIEYNIYHKVGAKKRIQEIIYKLEKYFDWVDANCLDEEAGLLASPISATKMENSPRTDAHFLVDFNAQQALSAHYMAELGKILNNKDFSFRFRKYYFSLKARINQLMWNAEDGFYYDLDKDGKQIKTATLASYWTLVASICNEDKAEKLIQKLQDKEWFGSENPFPSLAIKDQNFSAEGADHRGSVYPHWNFIVIKGLETYQYHELARQSAIKHIYHILDSVNPSSGIGGSLWEAFHPFKEGPALEDNGEPIASNRKSFLTYAALSVITLMIENIVGLNISLPRKTVDWTIPTLELMGIENLSLKRNLISILSNKGHRGWEIRLESEKLYYFTIDIIGNKRKTLPIPSGKCSMLIDKL